MSHLWSYTSSATPSIPTLPPRPEYAGNGVTSIETPSLITTVDVLSLVWNLWADKVEDIFRQLNNQSDSLDVSIEEYINWISRFSKHPARPTMSRVEEARHVLTGIPNMPLMAAQIAWGAFADEFAETYTIMARELERCRPLGGKQPMVEHDLGDLDFSKLSLEAGTSTRAQVKSVLSAMLGPGRSFHKVAGDIEGQSMAPPLREDHHRAERSVNRSYGVKQLARHLENGVALAQENRHSRKERKMWVNDETQDREYHELSLRDLDIKDQEMEG